MSYIGRQLNNLSDRVKLDSITASATATYNLLLNTVAYVPSSAESLTVSLNGVIQAPQDSYTVSGSTITFSSTLSALDSIDFILAERSITFQTPSSGSVGITELAVSDGTNGQALTTNGSGTLSFSTVGVSDGSVTMAKLSTSATESDNVEKRVGKVWVQFNGTGTVAIQSDFNVSSISDYGTGQYGVNFSTALADNDFAAVSGGVAGGYGSGTRVNDLSTTLCKIDVWSTSAYIDSSIVTLIILGNS